MPLDESLSIYSKCCCKAKLVFTQWSETPYKPNSKYVARIPVNEGLLLKSVLCVVHGQAHYCCALRLLRSTKGTRQVSTNCGLEGSALTLIREQGKDNRSIHYTYANRQLRGKGNFNIQLMSHLMIKLRLPTGQIFSSDAQTPGQEKFPKVEKYWRR